MPIEELGNSVLGNCVEESSNWSIGQFLISQFNFSVARLSNYSMRHAQVPLRTAASTLSKISKTILSFSIANR